MVDDSDGDIAASRVENRNDVLCVRDRDHPPCVIVGVEVDQAGLIVVVMVLELDEDFDLRLAAREFYVYRVVAVRNEEAFVGVAAEDQRRLRAAVNLDLFRLAVRSLCDLSRAIRAVLLANPYFRRNIAE